MTRRQLVQAGAASAFGLPVSGSSVRQTVEANSDLELTLTGAVQTSRGRTQGERADVTFDVLKRKNLWQSVAWGWSSGYNTADHEATVAVLEKETRLTIDIGVVFGADLSTPGAAGRYSATLRRVGERWEGTYQGKFESAKVAGKAIAVPRPPYPALPASSFVPPAPGEYTRLVFRNSDWDELRRRAVTTWGKAVLLQLSHQLSEPATDGANVHPAASIAAGWAFLGRLTGDSGAVKAARTATEQLLRLPLTSMDPAQTLFGLALALDFAGDQWEPVFRQTVTRYLEATASKILTNVEGGFDSVPGSVGMVRTYAAAGIALLAVIGSAPTETAIRRLLSLCERIVGRYIRVGLGERGFGAHGDTEQVAALEMILPFIHALRVAEGRDMAAGPRGEPVRFCLPLYCLRSFHSADIPFLLPYGADAPPRAGTPVSLFGFGLSSVRSSDLPALRNFIDRSGGAAAMVREPHHAAYALTAYPETTIPRDYLTVLPNRLYDPRTGFVLFRSGGFVATLTADARIAKVSADSDAGGFRIHGLGTDWAVGAGGGRSGEGVVQVQTPGLRATGGGKVIFEESRRDGSGAVSLELSSVYQSTAGKTGKSIRAERAFLADYSGKCGSSALFVIVDRVQGGAEYRWLWHTGGTSVTATDSGFIVAGADGATLLATFLTPDPVFLNVSEKGGVHTVTVPVTNRTTAIFEVVVTIQRGVAPSVTVSGRGKDRVVRVGGQEIRLEEVR